MTEPEGRTRLDRLERAIERIAKMAADTQLVAVTLRNAFELDRNAASRERRELRSQVGRVVADTAKVAAAVARTEADVKEFKPQLEKVTADVANVSANQVVLTSDIGRIKPIVEREEIRRHRREGARAFKRKQWAALAAAGAAVTAVLGMALGWWPHLATWLSHLFSSPRPPHP